jgi:hypothetical protein
MSSNPFGGAYGTPRHPHFDNAAFFCVQRAVKGFGSSWSSIYNPANNANWPGSINAAPATRTISVTLSVYEVNMITGERQEGYTVSCADIGFSNNPFSDVLQLEGGNIYGKGYFIYESNDYDSKGVRINPDTWEYKPHCTRDTPSRMDSLILNNPTSALIPGNSTQLPAGLPNGQKYTGEIVTASAGSAGAIAILGAINSYRTQVLGLSSTNTSWMDQTNMYLSTEAIKAVAPLPTTV